MEFIKKNKYGVIAISLFCIGIISLIFGNNSFIQGGITCISWAIASITMGLNSKQRGINQLKNFDQGAEEILQDLEMYKENSEYFGTVNYAVINKKRAKLVKSINTQVITCYILAGILIITCILCII